MTAERDLLADVAEAVVIRPGDTLLLRLALNVTESQLERCRERLVPSLKAKLPGVEVIVIGGAEQIAAYRPGPTVDAEG